MAVKGGKLLEEQLGRRPCARFKTQIEQGYNKVQRRAKRIKTVRFATPKQNGIAGQIVPSKGSWSWRRQLLNCLPVKDGRLRARSEGIRSPSEQSKKMQKKAASSGKSTLRHALTGWQ